MMYDYNFYPHFFPRMYSSYSQSRSRFVNKNHSNFNRLYNNETSNTKKTKLNKESSRNKNFNNKKEQSTTLKQNHKSALTNQQQLHEKTYLNNNSDIVFEILGIKLHYDDILLICLIFFLYNEGVKDEFLFIALILLLLS